MPRAKSKGASKHAPIFKAGDVVNIFINGKERLGIVARQWGGDVHLTYWTRKGRGVVKNIESVCVSRCFKIDFISKSGKMLEKAAKMFGQALTNMEESDKLLETVYLEHTKVKK